MKIPNTYIIYILLAVVLFFPVKYLALYILFVTCSLCLANLVYGFSLPKNNSIFLMAFFYTLLIISTSIGVFYYGTEPIRNSTELIRFLPILLLMASIRRVSPTIALNCLVNVFFVYTICNLTVSYFQTKEIAVIQYVTSIYSAPLHIENSLAIASRALGLSTGPGPNGAIMAVIFAFSISQSLIGENKIRPMITAALSFFVVVLAQSQTAFIVAVFGFAYIMVLATLFLDMKRKYLAFIYIVLAVPTAIVIIMKNADQFKYLFTLFSHGLERNSYQARLSKNDRIFELIVDNPFTIIFGHGKDYFGPVSGHMDNEYVFILGVYGLIATLVIFIFYLYVIISPLVHGPRLFITKKFLFPLHVIVLMGMIMAWPSSFLLDPRLLFIVSFLYLMHKRNELLETKIQSC